ncbi:MAG: hypothetical protein ACFB14_00235 [Leptolyngbyaceae cyanobacterium]
MNFLQRLFGKTSESDQDGSAKNSQTSRKLHMIDIGEEIADIFQDLNDKEVQSYLKSRSKNQSKQA